ncbi:MULTISPECIES: hypothetical protein [Methylobacterium]|uniref:hypothetical protein n=1 Tax=Methylobacterium TaxID=407 RepID=UPI0013EDA145|nr:hypothetical protein [Methylobacterium sp. DB0501]NGM33527.1 hypothetical protein [Methylobacterium sp. DB0501]
MIVTGASLLGQILTNRTSSGALAANPLAAKAASVPDKPPPQAGPASPPVAMSLSTLDGLFALQMSARGTGIAAAPAAPAGIDPASAQTRPRTGGQTAVDPDLVRAIAAALESRKGGGDGAGLAALAPDATVALETSVSRQNSLREALELAGRGPSSALDPQDRASFH